MSVGSFLTATFWMFSVVAVLLLLTSLVGAQDTAFGASADKAYPHNIHSEAFHLAADLYSGKNFEEVPEYFKSYGREPHGPLEDRQVLYQKASIPTDSLHSESFIDNVDETSGLHQFNTNPSLNYQPPPPPVRREVLINPRCSFDAEKWSMHPESSISNAIMFHRTTGITCEKCLKLCQKKQKKPWTCRSVVYDSRWEICDLFAVTSSFSPFDLVEYKGRYYFEYLNASTPSGNDLDAASSFSRRDEEVSIIDCKRLMDQVRQAAAAGVKNIEQLSNGSLYEAIPLNKQVEADEKNEANSLKEEEKKDFKQTKSIKDKFALSPLFITTSPSFIPDILTTAEETQDSQHSDDDEEAVKETGSAKKDPEINFEDESLELFNSQKTFTSPPTPQPELEDKKFELPEQKQDEVTEISLEPISSTVPISTSTLSYEETKEVGSESDEQEEQEELETATDSFLRTTQHQNENHKDKQNNQNDAFVLEGKSTGIKEVQRANRPRHFGAVRSNREGGQAIAIPRSEIVEEIRQKHNNRLIEEYTRDSVCQDDYLSAMVDFISATRKPFSAEIHRKVTTTSAQCSDLCARDDDCSSSIFSPLGCELASTKVEHHSNLVFSSSCTYSEKVCVPRKYIIDRAVGITAMTSYLLVGYVEVVETAKTLDECVTSCLEASYLYGFDCLSAMWYPTDSNQNCLLNSASRRTAPSRFLEDDESNVVFFEFNEDLSTSLTSEYRQRRLKDDSSERKFTAWSSCVGKPGDFERTRYSKCNILKDIRKCPKETTLCGSKASKLNRKQLEVLTKLA